MTGARVDQTASCLLLEYMIETRLIAGDANVDFVGSSLDRF